MKPSIELLKKALKACADAHHVDFEQWTEDEQIGIRSEDVPVVADIRIICRAFCGEANIVETGWGYTTIYLDEAVFLPEVDMQSLSLALPHGTTI